ncbi:MAG: hypothetical protein ABH829_02980 [archaeon]
MAKNYSQEINYYIRLHIDEYKKYHRRSLPKNAKDIISYTLETLDLYPELAQAIESDEPGADAKMEQLIRRAITAISDTKQSVVSRPKYRDKRIIGAIYLILESSLASVRRDASFKKYDAEKRKHAFSSADEAKKYVLDFAKRAVDIGGDNIDAILLFGSLSKALEYRPGKSDLDIVIISKDSLPPQPGCYKHCNVHTLIGERENYNIDTEYSDECISFCYRGFKDFLAQHTHLVTAALAKNDWREATEIQSNLHNFSILYTKNKEIRRRIVVFTKNLVDVVEEEILKNLDAVLDRFGYS